MPRETSREGYARYEPGPESLLWTSTPFRARSTGWETWRTVASYTHVGVWAQMTIDKNSEMVISPSHFRGLLFGGHRPVTHALRKRGWRSISGPPRRALPLVHHGIWDLTFLARDTRGIIVEGKAISHCAPPAGMFVVLIASRGNRSGQSIGPLRKSMSRRVDCTQPFVTNRCLLRQVVSMTFIDFTPNCGPKLSIDQR